MGDAIMDEFMMFLALKGTFLLTFNYNERQVFENIYLVLDSAL